MILHLITFLLKGYIRSYRYFPPLLFSVISIMMLYSYRPNPVMASYSVSSIIVYFASAWVCYSFLSSIEVTHGQILSIHAGSVRTYLWGKTAAICFCCLIIDLFALLYPVATHMFEETVSAQQLLLALIVHIELSLLGLLLALFFNYHFFKSASFTIASILLVLIVTLAREGIIEEIGESFAVVFWLLPPAYQGMELLNHYPSYPSGLILITLSYPLVYFCMLYYLYMFLWKRRM
ncbi:hypothetical protein [Paenibacillus sp. PL2-23]|uniref:hypothetical protein n=1 Tax=Paenibacillus sp. PL2-23 TaxID=2100729 RepID=UPI0030FC7FE6